MGRASSRTASSTPASKSKPASIPHALLFTLHKIEKKFGRDRAKEKRWGPRTLDLDLIAYDDVTIDKPELTLPHPRLFERAFVLVPLAEIAPDRVIAGRTVTAGAGRPVDRGNRAAAGPRLTNGPTLYWLRSHVAISGQGKNGSRERSAAMTSATDDLRLAADFAPATYDDWRKLVDGVLKGAPFEKLVGKTYDGLRIEPIYPRARDAAPIAGRAAARRGRSCSASIIRMRRPPTRRRCTTSKTAPTGWSLSLPADRAHAASASPIERKRLARVLDGVYFRRRDRHRTQSGAGRDNAGMNLADLIEARGFEPAKVDIRFNYQPLATMAVRGAAPAPWPEMAPRSQG